MQRSATKFFNALEARARAERILPGVLFNYLDGGSSVEQTLRENVRAFDDVAFRPKAAAIPLAPDLSTTIFGTQLSMPVALAPIGGLRLFYPDGASATVRAAAESGSVAILGTNAGTSPEDGIAAAGGKAWFQLYFRGGREGAEVLVDRVQRAGFGALFVTLDVAGGIQTARLRRDVDKLSRLKGENAHDWTIPLGINLRNAMVFAPYLARHLRWTAGFVRDGVPTDFANQADVDVAKRLAEVREANGGDEPTSNGAPVAWDPEQKFPSWADMDWIREVWKGPLIAKGIMTGDDARRALDHGADGVHVSNHGGRQLDGTLPTLRVLPEVRRAVGPSVPVVFDSGVRNGSDVFKALALGADTVVIGRAYAYGLAAAGGPGVKRILDIVRNELELTMKSLGVGSIKEIDRLSIDDSKLFLAERLAAIAAAGERSLEA